MRQRLRRIVFVQTDRPIHARPLRSIPWSNMPIKLSSQRMLVPRKESVLPGSRAPIQARPCKTRPQPGCGRCRIPGFGMILPGQRALQGRQRTSLDKPVADFNRPQCSSNPNNFSSSLRSQALALTVSTTSFVYPHPDSDTRRLTELAILATYWSAGEVIP